MTTAPRFRTFLRDSQGAVTVFFVILFPLLLLIGGLATDVTMLNAQKRYVQSQADLAAQSAARHLPDAAAVRGVARSVVARNARYGEIVLADADILLGSYDPGDGTFAPHPNQSNPVGSNAVQVVVPSPFRPVLLRPVLQDENITIRRAAVAVQNDIIVFSLRNSLLGVNTQASVLDPLLQNVLGLRLATHVAGYRGLADARVGLNNLLGLGAEALNLGIDAGVVTFNDVLNAPIRLSSLLGLDPLGSLLTPSGAGSAPATLLLGDLLKLSPGLAEAHIGDVLPDISVNALDLVTAMLGLAGAKLPDDERLEIGLGLNLGPLANLDLTVGLLSQPVTVVARMSDSPLPAATIEQADVEISADVVDLGAAGLPTLIGLDLDLGAIRARAEPNALHCNATGGQTLAEFTVTPSLADLGLSARVLQSRVDSHISAALRGLVSITIESHQAGRNLVGTPQRVAISHQQFQTGEGVTVGLTSLFGPLRDAVRQLINGLEIKVTLLGGLLGPLLNILLNSVLGIITNLVLVPVLSLLAGALDGIVMGLLQILGVQILPAELVVHDFSCAGKLAL